MLTIEKSKVEQYFNLSKNLIQKMFQIPVDKLLEEKKQLGTQKRVNQLTFTFFPEIIASLTENWKALTNKFSNPSNSLNSSNSANSPSVFQKIQADWNDGIKNLQEKLKIKKNMNIK